MDDGGSGDLEPPFGVAEQHDDYSKHEQKVKFWIEIEGTLEQSRGAICLVRDEQSNLGSTVDKGSGRGHRH